MFLISLTILTQSLEVPILGFLSLMQASTSIIRSVDPLNHTLYLALLISKNDIQDLAAGRRRVEHYVVPNEYALPKLTLEQQVLGWDYGMFTIEDNLAASGPSGHGTPVACIAGGSTYGVSWGSNLYLIKIANEFVKIKPQGGLHGKWVGVPDPAWLDAFMHIHDFVAAEGIDPSKCVIMTSISLSSPPQESLLSLINSRYEQDP